MTATLQSTANDILNRVAVEVNKSPSPDPFSDPDPDFQKLTYLLNIAGEELCQLHPWEFLVKEHSIVTADTDSGDYDLPADFLYMINQTGWERAENVPIFGPLSAQDWQYLLGRDLVSHTIYASFRINEGKYRIFPQPPPNGLELHYEYCSRNWAIDSSTGNNLVDRCDNGADRPLFDRTLLSRYVKVKWLEARGFDSSKAQADLNQIFGLLTAHDEGSEILNAGRHSRGFPYLEAYHNLPDTGYGR